MSGERDNDPAVPGHLSAEEVLKIIDFMTDSDPVIVGGQSINIWAKHYASVDQVLYGLGPLTSKDVDFFANTAAMERLASHLTDSQIHVPSFGDMTPNAAVVVGFLGKRRIVVDFMAVVMGVPDDSITNNYVAIEGAMPDSGRTVKLCLMHPLDCVKSRLANINLLNRVDDHPVTQAVASLRVLQHFIDELISVGAIKEAQRTLHQLPYVFRDLHLGQKSHRMFGQRLDFSEIFDRFAADERLDLRWRELCFKKAVDRMRVKAAKLEQRQQQASDHDDGDSFSPPKI